MKKQLLLSILSVLTLCACGGTSTSSNLTSSSNGTTDVSSSESSSTVGETSSSESSNSEVVLYTITSDTSSIPEEVRISVSLYQTSYAKGAEARGTIYIGNNLYSVTSLIAKDHDELSITLEALSYGTSFSFIMPAYNVTLVPTVTKSESQTITLEEPKDENILSIDIYGNKTGYDNRLLYNKVLQEGEKNIMSLGFVPNDTLTATVKVFSQETKIPVIKFEGSQEDTNSYYHFNSDTYYGPIAYYFYDIVLPSDASKIVVSLEDKPTYNIEISNDNQVPLEYKINGEGVENLNNVSLLDSIEIAIKEGTKGIYKISIKSKDGTKILMERTNSVSYTVHEEFKVEVTKDSEHCAVHLDNKTDVSGLYVSIPSGGIVDANKELNPGYFTISNYSSDKVKVSVTIKVGEQVALTKTLEIAVYASESYIGDAKITATDDIYVEVSLAS